MLGIFIGILFILGCLFGFGLILDSRNAHPLVRWSGVIVCVLVAVATFASTFYGEYAPHKGTAVRVNDQGEILAESQYVVWCEDNDRCLNLPSSVWMSGDFWIGGENPKQYVRVIATVIDHQQFINSTPVWRGDGPVVVSSMDISEIWANNLTKLTGAILDQHAETVKPLRQFGKESWEDGLRKVLMADLPKQLAGSGLTFEAVTFRSPKQRY